MTCSAKPYHAARGFSLIETMVSILILGFGVLALSAVYTQGMALMSNAQFEYIAQQKAAEAIETIFTARDTKVLTWPQIRNVSAAAGPAPGVFLDGPQPLLAPGLDGLVGTADDNANMPDAIILPGPDGVLGTADDERLVLDNFTREIQIRDLNPSLRQVTVTVIYKSGKFLRKLQVVSYISSYA